MIKASLPYMNASSAKPMALLARFMELQNTMRYFNSPGKIKACAIGSRRPTPEEMLSDLRKYCDGNEAQAIDRFLNAMKIGHFYEKFKDMESNPDFNKIINSLNSGGSHDNHYNPRGGDTMGQSFHPEQLLKNIPPELLKNFNPEMLKNFDVNKFNQLMQAFNSGNPSGASNSPDEPRHSTPRAPRQAAPREVDNSFNEEQLKALLTPEQLKLFESLKNSMN